MTEKLSGVIYNDIRSRIVSRSIDERTFLTENDLAKYYKVSKAPVRDALNLLCARGYLMSYPRKGYMIKLYSIDEIHEMLIVRYRLEVLSVELVIKSATDESIESLRRFNEEYNHADDPSMTNNMLFHMGLAELTGNQYLIETLQGLVHNMSRYWINQEFDFKYHNALIDAMKARDLEQALICLKKDVYGTYEP